ncbi:MAG: hypothetical protein MJ072_02295, partial [Clostridia bacterium]|nr:hypothetical protein [Clostridia bacterium]
MNFKLNVKKIIIFSAVFVVLLITATFTDLSVSKILVDLKEGEYYTSNFFGVFCGVIGSFFGYGRGALGLIFLSLNTKRLKAGKWNVVLKRVFIVGGVIVTIIGVNSCATDFNKFFPSERSEIFRYLIITFVTAVLYVPALFIFENSSEDTVKRLFLFALVIAFTIGISQA